MNTERITVAFPNGREAELALDMDRLFTTEEELPMFVCRLCGFIEGSETERADKLFELIERIGEDAVSDKVMDNNEVFIEARREGFEIDDKYAFH
ncbi:MAG: hypothetical protein IJ794_00185 [Lachnospiraceae bacterium]|nr:hypothetical protein [Lachnospiraceae bacterium]